MKKLSLALVLLVATALALPAAAQPGNGRGQGQGNQGQGNQGQGNQGHGNPGQGNQGHGNNQGQGNQGRDNQGQGNQGQGAGPGQSARPNIVVTERDRGAIYGYYQPLYAAGNCPPGLAKKNNGCLPPGQAKKLWVVGQPLPAGVVFYPLPGALLGQLTPAPAGYQYVRVANDILMMAVGTRLIAGAIADLAAMGR
jgi:hypothetical protein